MKAGVLLRARGGSAGPALPWVVLAMWAATEATGVRMLVTFVRRGGMRDETLAPSYPATLFANGSLGTASVALWGLYLATRIRALAWVACGQLVMVNAIGTTLALPWHRAEHGGEPTPRGGGRPAFGYRHGWEAGHAALAWSTAVTAVVVASRPELYRRARNSSTVGR
jgi:hypothetical protein